MIIGWGSEIRSLSVPAGLLVSSCSYENDFPWLSYRLDFLQFSESKTLQAVLLCSLTSISPYAVYGVEGIIETIFGVWCLQRVLKQPVQTSTTRYGKWYG